VIAAMSQRIFLRLVQRAGVGDTLAALLQWEGVNGQMSQADEPLLHSGSRLDGKQLIYQLGIEAVAELGQGFG
jgi:hypothetical protein